jgi:hypothetical protein
MHGKKYEPPGDDDLSFANGGDAGPEIADRIRVGYPELAGPLVLLTVAERGPYVIAAAYLYSRNGGGVHTLKRIDRHVVDTKDIDASTVTKTWPECFALAIKRYVEEPHADAQSSCQKSEQRASGISTKTTAATQKGLLDGVDPQEGKITVLPPESASSKPPVSSPRTASAERPVQVGPAPTPSGQTVTKLANTMAPTKEAQLVEDVLAYGFSWRPGNNKREQVIKNVFSEMVSRPGRLGDCLRTLKNDIKHSHTIQGWMIDELRYGWAPHFDVKRIESNHYILDIGRPVPSNKLSEKLPR